MLITCCEQLGKSCVYYLNQSIPLYRDYKEEINGKSTNPYLKGNRKTT